MRLQKAPDLLTGWLNLKTEGLQPTEFGDTLQGVLELSDQYGHPSRDAVSAAGATLTPGALVATLSPPVTEGWRVKGLALILGRNVADIALSIRAVLSVRRATGPGVVIFDYQFPPTDATALVQSAGIWLPRQLLLSPTDRLACALQTTLSVAGTAGFSADIDRFPL